jgi:hypothetical protein
MLSAIMLSVVMLSAVVLNVVVMKATVLHRGLVLKTVYKLEYLKLSVISTLVKYIQGRLTCP